MSANTKATDRFEIVSLASIRTRRPVVEVVHGAIRFKDNDHYEIALHRCDTPEKLLGWVAHMAEKRWVTTQMLREMVQTASYHHGFTIHGLS